MPIALKVCLATLLLSSAVSAGSVDSGTAPYERCALCHGLFGDTVRTKFPKLAGQNAAYLEKQIHDFKDGLRTNDGGQMSTVVTEIDESEIPEIVNWFSTQPPPEALDTNDPEGESLFIRVGCSSCHLEQVSADSAMPLLSAQHPEYLSKQMREIRDGMRASGDSGVMKQQLGTLSDAEIDSIAGYLASRSRVP